MKTDTLASAAKAVSTMAGVYSGFIGYVLPHVSEERKSKIVHVVYCATIPCCCSKCATIQQTLKRLQSMIIKTCFDFCFKIENRKENIGIEKKICMVGK